MINLLWKWNANLTQQCPSPEMAWETRDLSILAALPPTLTPGLPWLQAAKPGDHGYPVLVPENAVPLVLLEQTTSRFLIGALRAVGGREQSRQFHMGFLRRLNVRLELNTMLDTAWLFPFPLPLFKEGARRKLNSPTPSSSDFWKCVYNCFVDWFPYLKQMYV